VTARIGRHAALALPALLAANGAGAQSCSPDRPVRFVEPFGPGNSTDAAARALAEALTVSLGTPTAFGAFPARERRQWGEVVRAASIRIE
jgi:tripartite-type tricarboxylate transporter receptor subunit TctC